jgi:predicted house-cleaning noncanonical NTP pyrophosphatase (MazG superfamily)
MIYNKLVRDKIPDIIKSKGSSPKTHIASDEEYGKKLKEKLQEEVNEFIESDDSEELADILEVIDAIIKNKEFDKDKIERIKNKKNIERGSFSKKIILENIE